MSPELPRLEPRRLAAPGSLAGDLLEGAPAALDLLPDGALPTAAGVLPPGAPTAAVRTGDAAGLPADLLRTAGPGADRRLEEVLEGEGVLVTTGQQPLLFLGPLYVLHKALTAVAVAGALREAGTPALALFWVAGDDHDWREVGRTRVLDRENRLRTVTLDPPGEREGRAVGPTPLDEGIGDRIDEMFDLLPDSEFAPEYLDLFREAYRPGRSVAEAFGRGLAGVLPDVAFAWLDASSPAVRRRAAPLYRRVLLASEDVEEAFLADTRAVEEAGYEPPIHRDGGGLPLFVDRPAGRSRVLREGDDRLRVGREGDPVPRDHLLEELEAHPERFSPNVVLRPVLASWLLPTAATVLGPGELAYWTQLPATFGWAGVPFPGLVPRDGWTVVEDKVGKVLEKLGAGPDDFEDGGGALVRRVRERGRPPRTEEALADARRAVGEAMDGVEAAVAEELPGLRSAVGAARHEAFQVLERLQQAVDGRVEEQNEVLLRQIRKAAAHLWPDGRPQERVLSPLYYLTRYGSAFVRLLAERARERRAGRASPG